jgi:type IV secretion system protein TrbE
MGKGRAPEGIAGARLPTFGAMIRHLTATLLETRPPDGWFDGNVLWFDTSLTPATILARGAGVRLPDLKSADQNTRDAFYEGLGTFFCQLAEDEAVQFQWRVDADYHAELEAYRANTAAAGATGWCRATREERYARYRARQAAGRLRRERLEVYVAKRCTSVPKGGFKTAEQVDRYVGQTAKNFFDRFRNLEGHLPGARVEPYGDREHFAAWRAFCQPTLRLLGPDRYRGFDPRGTILENTWPGGGITTRDTEGNVYFRMDGQFHTLLVLRRWPMETHLGVIWSLTSALAGNYCFSLNCYPLRVQTEVEKTEKELRKLKGNRVNEDKDSLDAVIQRKKEKVGALQGGFARPYSALPVIRVWGATVEQCLENVQAIKEAVTAMGGAQCVIVDDEVQAKCLFFETLPGWTGGRYRDWDLFALAGRDPAVCFLQDLVPLSSSCTGHLEEGEAIYDGEEGSLFGVRTFANGVPQHAVMTGTTRVGKSSQTIDLLSQTDCFFAFRGIVEEGLSYGTFVQLVGGESIVLHPDSDLTFNYLDTQGLPLTRMQVSSAAGLLAVMAGKAQDPDVNVGRASLYAEYIEQMFTDTWNDYRRRHPACEIEAARWALVLDRARQEAAAGPQALSLVEMFADLRELEATDPQRLREALDAVPEAELVAFARTAQTARLVRDLGLAFLAPAEFPTHTALVETMLYNRMPHHDKEVVNRLASRLAAWQRNGPNGRLFDGATNRPLARRVVHFELGQLPNSNPQMKEAAMYLIANRLRQRVITMPRAQRKQFIFEEPSRYIEVGGVEQLFGEFYAQMGKFACHIMPVTQQYGQLSKSALRSVIFGNSKQFFLFKQNDRHDLDEQGEAIGLPPAARAAIRAFTAPEYQSGEAKYSQMAVFSQDGEHTQCGVVRNCVTPEMLYVSDSSGERFDERTRALARYEDPVAGVFAEAARERDRKSTRSATEARPGNAA